MPLADHVEPHLVAQHVLGAHRAAAGGRDGPPAVRSARAVERPTREHLPDAAVGASRRVAVRVVVVVADPEHVAELVGVHAHAGALRLRGRALAGVGPQRRTGRPRGPLDVAGRGPVGQRLVGRAERVGHVLLLLELHLPELLPGRGLVLAGAEDVDEVEVVAHVLALGGLPCREGVLAQVLVAAVAAGAGGALLELHRVLVGLARHLVRAELGELHAVAAAGVLHPVLVDRVAAVELVGRVEEVPVEPGYVLARDRARLGAGVAEHRGVGRVRDRERLVGVVDDHEGPAEGPLRALLGGVGPVGPGDPGVVRPRHVVGVLPVLRVDRRREARLADALRGPDAPQVRVVRRALPRLGLRPVVVAPVVGRLPVATTGWLGADRPRRAEGGRHRHGDRREGKT